MSNISRWDGAQWLPLGSGVNGTVYTIIVDSIFNELYVFGSFTSAGGIPVNGQAKWNEKTQSWSALGTQLSSYLSSFESKYYIATSNGKIYYCNSSPNVLYNTDRTYVDKTGLYLWNGTKWELLLDKIKGRNENSSFSISRLIGTSLYLSSYEYNENSGLNRKFYLFDIVSHQIIDSLPNDISNPPLKYVSILPEGIFTIEDDGVYRFLNGSRKPIISFTTKNTENEPYIHLSATSEYVSYIDKSALHFPEVVIAGVIYDSKADTTYDFPLNPIKNASLYSSKISGHILFVGGAFYLKDVGTDVRNIGAFDLVEKRWYDLAGGVCGPVYSIAEMNGSIYVGGAFSTAGKK